MSTTSSTTSPTSTISSQRTLFEDPTLERVFLAGCLKNFVGNGPRRLSKYEIKRLDVSDFADLVSRKTRHARFSEAITYYLGLCRIIQKAVIFLEEDVVKLNDDVNSVLYGVNSALSSKNKKTKKKRKDLEGTEGREVGEGTEDREIDAESIHSLQLADHDFIALFPRNLGTDRHLRVEMDDRFPPVDTLGDFGDEIHLQNGRSDESVRDIHMEPLGPEPLMPGGLVNEAGEQQFLDGREAAGETTEDHPTASPSRRAPNERRDAEEGDHSIKSTPKRKSRMGHDQTPSKRQRKSSGSDGKSSASRRLFPQDEPNEIVLHPNEDQQGMDPFDERMPLQEIQEGTGRISIQIDPDAVQDHEPDQQPEQVPASPRQGPVIPEIIEPAPADDQSTHADPSLPNAQHPTDAYTEDSDDIELEVLDDETITALTPRRRRRLTKVFDEEKQISRQIDINDIAKSSKLHTRKMETTRFDFDSKKRALRNMFSLPATGSKRAWGNKLQKLFFKMACPIPHPRDEDACASSVPRDFNVDKRPRFSSFRLRPRPDANVPSLSEDQNITGGGIGDDNADPDRQLMPPPATDLPVLSRPPDERQTPRTPDRSHHGHDKPPSLPSSPQQQLPGQRSPRTPNRLIQPGTSAASPKTPVNQPLLVPGIIEPATGGEQSGYPDLPDAAQMSPSTASSRERSLLMKDQEFYKFLEELWVIRMYRVDLDHVINPQRSTLTTFYRYFNYLQRFQVERKLTMIQEIIYGPVHILKGTNEQRE